jgi:uncharacterized protein involved in exopolysaccharide biosynthesis
LVEIASSAADVNAMHQSADDTPEGEVDLPRADAAESRSEWHGPLESIVMRPRLFVLPIIVLVTIALLVGFLRPPVYSATSQLIVGSVVRDFQTTDGQVLAIQQLGDIYSRLAGSTAHMEKVDAALGETVPNSAISASPIPDSALVRLDATGSSQEEATARGDAGAQQLVAYVEQLRSEATANAEALLSQINAASVEFAAATTAQAAAAAVVTNGTSANPAAAQQALQQADAAVTTANLKLETLKSNYTKIQQQNSGGISLSVFSPATPTGSDRKSMLQIYGIGALVLGALLGMALATLSANRWQLIPRSKEPETAT